MDEKVRIDPSREGVISDQLEKALRHIESMRYQTLDAAMNVWQDMTLSLQPLGNPYAFKFHYEPNDPYPFTISVNRSELFDQEIRDRDAIKACSAMVNSPEWPKLREETDQTLRGAELKKDLEKWRNKKK